MARIWSFFVFMTLCSQLSAGSIKIKIVALYDVGEGFYVVGDSLTRPCLGEPLEFYFPSTIVDSASVYDATNAFFENKPVSIVYRGGEQVCDDGQLHSMEIISDE